MVKLILENVSKYYTNLVAVNQINLTIDEGEFFSLLGPSGSGKTTFLKIVSGFLSPSKGRLYFNSKEVTRVSQSKRNIGYVPQNNSLQPHLTVGENIANGLKKYNITRNEVNKRTNKSLFLVGLPDVFNKLPKQLSYGQRQQVALAGAIALEPDILLLDNPFSDLDINYRSMICEKIKDVQQKLGMTIIYVTQDQEEATTISDRIGIMNHGNIVQVGSPNEVYNKPDTLFVASFLGKRSIIEGMVEEINEKITVNIGDISIEGVNTGNIPVYNHQHVACVMRQENIFLEKPDAPYNLLKCVIENSFIVGPNKKLKLNYGVTSFMVDAPVNREYVNGEPLNVYIPKDKTIILPWAGRY